MPKWADLLKDKTLYPDDFTVVVRRDGKEESLSLGDMRAYDAESRGALTADLTRRETEILSREKNVNDASVQLATVIEKTATAAGMTVDELLQGKAPTRKAVAVAADLDESDPLVGSLVKEIKSLRSEIQSVKADSERTRKDALGPMLTTYLEDYYDNTWEKLEPTLPKGAKVSRDEAIKYANDNGYKDSRGRLDLRKAAKDLTYDARVKAEAETMAADLRKKDDDARVLAAAPKPSGTHINVKTDKSLLNSKGRTKDFDEVLNDALIDTDMWKGIQNVQ